MTTNQGIALLAVVMGLVVASYFWSRLSRADWRADTFSYRFHEDR